MPERVTEETMARLRELLEKATPRPWAATKRNPAALIDAGIHPDGGRGIRIVTCSNATRAIQQKSDDDMELIAELRNAAPALLDTIDRQQAEIAELLKALQPFLKFNSSEEWTELKVRSEDVKRARGAVANLSATAEVHDRRVKAEGAAEALESFAERDDWEWIVLAQAHVSVRERIRKMRELLVAEAARLREGKAG